jgi:hypothetical protein
MKPSNVEKLPPLNSGAAKNKKFARVGSRQGCGSGSDPDSVTLWIRIQGKED